MSVAGHVAAEVLFVLVEDPFADTLVIAATV